MIGIPDLKTISAASGSMNILNSAEGVTFPKPTDPPIKDILSILFFSSGYLLKNNPILVKGPVAIIVTLSPLSLITLAIRSMA